MQNSAYFFCIYANYLIMKKFISILVLILLIILGATNLPQQEDYDYLRIHIRANSNTDLDQNIKYQIKDEVVKILTPYLCNVPTKQKAIDIILSLDDVLEAKCNNMLKQNGFNYKANIKINNEYFPARSYGGTTLDSGYYDAVIIELGQAVGDNWWCVMYPPLCFVNNFETNKQINYKSKIYEWFKSVFN